MSSFTLSSNPPWQPTRPSGFPAPVFYRQSTAADLCAMAQRAGVKHLMLTHLIAPLGADQLGRYKLPVVLTEVDDRKPVEDAGVQGNIIVGSGLRARVCRSNDEDCRVPDNCRNGALHPSGSAFREARCRGRRPACPDPAATSNRRRWDRLRVGRLLATVVPLVTAASLKL
jgi:hypothetical protein